MQRRLLIVMFVLGASADYEASPFSGRTENLLRACGGFSGNVIKKTLPTPTVDSH